MTGTIEAQYVIPIVAFLLLVVWISLVYYADSHPYWRGRRLTPQQPVSQLPNLAEAMEARPPAAGAEPHLPAGAQVPRPAQPEPATGEPAYATQRRPAVPGQRQPTLAGQPLATAGGSQPQSGATAATGRLPGQASGGSGR